MDRDWCKITFLFFTLVLLLIISNRMSWMPEGMSDVPMGGPQGGWGDADQRGGPGPDGGQPYGNQMGDPRGGSQGYPNGGSMGGPQGYQNGDPRGNQMGGQQGYQNGPPRGERDDDSAVCRYTTKGNKLRVEIDMSRDQMSKDIPEMNANGKLSVTKEGTMVIDFDIEEPPKPKKKKAKKPKDDDEDDEPEEESDKFKFQTRTPYSSSSVSK